MPKKGPPRSIDPELVQALAADGMNNAQIGREIGASAVAVRRLLDPEFNARLQAASKRHQMSGVCAGCGGPRWKYAKDDRCRQCRKALHT